MAERVKSSRGLMEAEEGPTGVTFKIVDNGHSVGCWLCQVLIL